MEAFGSDIENSDDLRNLWKNIIFGLNPDNQISCNLAIQVANSIVDAYVEKFKLTKKND